MKRKQILSWIFRIIPAVILLQTLYFKFTAAPESVYIFSTLGMEPWGRIGTGVAELIFGILLLIPRTGWLGAVGGAGVTMGAIFFHLTKLGIDVQGDGGALFAMACIVVITSLIVLWIHKDEVLETVKTRNLQLS